MAVSCRTLAIALAGIGFFSGIYHPAALGLISKQVNRISYGMGINGMFGNLGLAMAPLVTGVVTWLWGPQSVYVVLGGLNFLGLVIMAVLPLQNSESGGPQYKADGGGKGFLILLVNVHLPALTYLAFWHKRGGSDGFQRYKLELNVNSLIYHECC